jgi:hypothetical protein
MSPKEKKLKEQNEILKDLIEGLEDAKAGRVKDIPRI